ncbi:hypothetical protein [Specibacter cremeus]|uniref:hypothetical protein n=1 Tax=Specibacter cremeus TaxID=1629051 RepID=UPI000F79B018|nr:hypothetical protein [Specibacter cremeus]
MTTPGPGTTSRPRKYTGLGTIVLAAVFLVALVLAANNSTVLGWVIAAIAFGWLVLSTLVYVGVHKAAKFGANQMRMAQAQFAQQASAANPAGTRLVDDGGTRRGDDGATRARDMKLDHSFKIIQVQLGVVREYLDREYPGTSPGMVERALETIEITAHNGRDMITPDDGGDAVSGTVIE